MMEFKHVKLETYIPESHLKDLQKALQEADAGHIGNYDSCTSYYRVFGTWRPLKGADPYNGKVGEVSEGEEIKVEVYITGFSTTCKINQEDIKANPFPNTLNQVINLHLVLIDFYEITYFI